MLAFHICYLSSHVACICTLPTFSLSLTTREITGSVLCFRMPAYMPSSVGTVAVVVGHISARAATPTPTHTPTLPAPLHCCLPPLHCLPPRHHRPLGGAGLYSYLLFPLPSLTHASCCAQQKQAGRQAFCLFKTGTCLGGRRQRRDRQLLGQSKTEQAGRF